MHPGDTCTDGRSLTVVNPLANPLAAPNCTGAMLYFAPSHTFLFTREEEERTCRQEAQPRPPPSAGRGAHPP